LGRLTPLFLFSGEQAFTGKTALQRGLKADCKRVPNPPFFHLPYKIRNLHTILCFWDPIRRNRTLEDLEPFYWEVLQNISGGTLSGDFSPKTNMFSAKNTPKIHRDPYFATLPFSYL